MSIKWRFQRNVVESRDPQSWDGMLEGKEKMVGVEM